MSHQSDVSNKLFGWQSRSLNGRIAIEEMAKKAYKANLPFAHIVLDGVDLTTPQGASRYLLPIRLWQLAVLMVLAGSSLSWQRSETQDTLTFMKYIFGTSSSTTAISRYDVLFRDGFFFFFLLQAKICKLPGLGTVHLAKSWCSTNGIPELCHR
jgi:hypothetical protein